MFSNGDVLRTVSKVGGDKGESRVRNPKVEESLFRRMLWSMVSKAADKSKRTSAETFC